jgi:hypothetical protein
MKFRLRLRYTEMGKTVVMYGQDEGIAVGRCMIRLALICRHLIHGFFILITFSGGITRIVKANISKYQTFIQRHRIHSSQQVQLVMRSCHHQTTKQSTKGPATKPKWGIKRPTSATTPRDKSSSI